MISYLPRAAQVVVKRASWMSQPLFQQRQDKTDRRFCDLQKVLGVMREGYLGATKVEEGEPRPATTLDEAVRDSQHPLQRPRRPKQGT